MNQPKTLKNMAFDKVSMKDANFIKKHFISDLDVKGKSLSKIKSLVKKHKLYVATVLSTCKDITKRHKMNKKQLIKCIVYLCKQGESDRVISFADVVRLISNLGISSSKFKSAIIETFTIPEIYKCFLNTFEAPPGMEHWEKESYTQNVLDRLNENIEEGMNDIIYSHSSSSNLSNCLLHLSLKKRIKFLDLLFTKEDILEFLDSVLPRDDYDFDMM